MKQSFLGISDRPVTTSFPFLQCDIGDQHYHLFKVIPGVPISLAIEQAVCILYAAHKTNSALLENQKVDEQAKWAVCYLMEMAHALVESVLKAVDD